MKKIKYLWFVISRQRRRAGAMRGAQTKKARKALNEAAMDQLSAGSVTG